MGVLDLVRGRRSEQVIAEGHEYSHDEKRKAAVSDDPAHSSDTDSQSNLSLAAKEDKEVREHGDQITQDAQLGIQKAEAAALVWSKTTVYCIYAWIWVCFFMLALQSSIMFLASSEFFSSAAIAPANATASILGGIVGGVLRIPIAKILNIWGRTEGYVIFFFVYLIGLIVLASCNDATTYAAGYTLYWIGYDAVYLILDIFIADTSSLKNRAFTWAFASTPFICTAFTGPLAGNAFLQMTSWRWALGAFAIIQPVVFLPLAVVFKFYQRKAAKQGLFIREPSGRTAMQSIIHYFHEFDMVGALIIMTAFVFFLLPFSLVTYEPDVTYESPTFIALVVIGIVLFPVFYVWERYFARVHFMPWQLLKERTVLGACVLAGVIWFNFYAWDNTLLQYLLVVYDETYVTAGYVMSIYNVGSCFWGVVFGLWVKYTHHFKYNCLFFAVPLYILGTGLMIHFRGDQAPIGYIVMTQIFIAFGGGTLVIGGQLAVMAAADRAGIPLMLSLLSLFNQVGGAIGSAVAVSIYGNVFPSTLRNILPDNLKDQAQQWFLDGYLTQTSYAPGTVERQAFNEAWARVQFYQCTVATAVFALAFPAVFAWKNYNVNRKQNKGTVI